MRRAAFYVLAVIAILALACSYGAAKDETVDELKARFASARPAKTAPISPSASHSISSALPTSSTAMAGPTRPAPPSTTS